MKNKDLNNPFLLTGFYSKQYFCDRRDELSTLLEHFENERNVALYSWRRLGKTALIRYCISMLETENIAETVYVDLMGTRDMQTAVRYIVQAVFDRFARTKSGISDAFQRLLGSTGFDLSFDGVTGAPKISLGHRSPEAFSKSLQAIGDFLVTRKKKVLFVIDEFQQITRYTDENGESVFRSWMQSFPAIRFIYSGSHPQMMVSMFSHKNRPFYLSSQLIQLNPIDEGRYMKFIRKLFKAGGKTIEEKAVKEIFYWSRMQTYCIQLVCNKLYGRFNKVTAENLSPVYHEILDQEGALFSGYTRLLSRTQWKVLKAVALEEPLDNPLSQGFIGKYDLGASSSVSTALEMLQRNEIVLRDQNSYIIHEVLLSRWLQSL